MLPNTRILYSVSAIADQLIQLVMLKKFFASKFEFFSNRKQWLASVLAVSTCSAAYLIRAALHVCLNVNQYSHAYNLLTNVRCFYELVILVFILYFMFSFNNKSKVEFNSFCKEKNEGILHVFFKHSKCIFLFKQTDLPCQFNFIFLSAQVLTVGYIRI